MFSRILMASIGAIALAGTGFAADLPSRAPPPVYVPPAPIFTWTGVYIGGQIGYAWGNDHAHVTAFDPGTPGALGTPGTPGTPAVVNTDCNFPKCPFRNILNRMNRL
jgi:outer membrane immunogenic protein